jgi:tRNA(Ile)-lysidine synthase
MLSSSAALQNRKPETSSSAAPLTVVELGAALDALGGFEPRPQIAVAVSGGPDSMALILLALRWARQRGGEAWALTVDHGLRPESAEEARTVAGWLGGRSIPHEILVWDDAKPTSGLQERAREARYRLLAQWCRAHGVLHLLTAHHREDQVETYLIRRRAGSGPDGLAGMPSLRELAGCRLIRPLLAAPRARLLALLAQAGQPFLRDPSNLNPAFERARLRMHPPERPDDVEAELRACGTARIGRERALDDYMARTIGLHPAGIAALEGPALSGVAAELAERLLGRLAACVGAARYPARRERLARLRAGMMAQPDRARTLGGCRFVPWRGRLLVLRELAAASPPVWLEPGADLLWDRRFAVDLAATAPRGVWLGYLGQSGAAARERGTGGLPRLVHSVLPALWDEEGLAAVPHLGYHRTGVGVLPRLFFRPANPLTRAGFTVV